MIETRYFLPVFHGLLVGPMCVCASPSAEQMESTMNLADTRVAEKFTAFRKEQDIALVYAALDQVEAASREVLAGNAMARRPAVSRWLHFLAGLDGVIDPEWDVKKVPLGVAPPPTGGEVYSSGEVDPATIADPVARAEYEEALKADKNYAKRYRAQLQLRRIDEIAMRFVERFLAERYTNSEPDRREFEALLTGSPINDLRKQRLRALMPTPG